MVHEVLTGKATRVADFVSMYKKKIHRQNLHKTITFYFSYVNFTIVYKGYEQI